MATKQIGLRGQFEYTLVLRTSVPEGLFARMAASLRGKEKAMFRGILIVLLAFVIFLAAFALQNTGPATMQFFNFVIPVVPLYGVVIVSAALGAIITALVAVWARVGLSLRGRPVRRKAVEQVKTVADLTSQVATLQAEREGLAKQVEQLNLEGEGLRSRIGGLEMGLSLAQAAANKPVESDDAEIGPTAEPVVEVPTEQVAEPVVPVTEELVTAEPHHWWSPS
jgi:uncharacterized integral membrane protein